MSYVVQNEWTHYEEDCTKGGCSECYEWSRYIVYEDDEETEVEQRGQRERA